MINLKKYNISILVVEDNPIDTLVFQALLQPYFNLVTVTNGFDALKKIEEVKFDLILMDINLGNIDMDGSKVMKTIRRNKKHKDVKIYAVTSYPDDVAFFTEQGFDDLYVKPVIKEEIFEFINKHLSLSFPEVYHNH